jgi:hypothetical protein
MIDWLQWPATPATPVAAWLVASQRRAPRLAGFALFVVSNVLWIAWALPIDAYALIVLQIGLFVLTCAALIERASVPISSRPIWDVAPVLTKADPVAAMRWATHIENSDTSRIATDIVARVWVGIDA